MPPRKRKAAQEEVVDLSGDADGAGTSAAAGGAAPARRTSRARRAVQYVEIGEDDEAIQPEEQQPKPKRARKSRQQAQQAQQDSHQRQPQQRSPQAQAQAPAQAQPEERRVDLLGRAVSYQPTASQAVKERIDRALARGAGYAHRMYLIDTQRVRGPDNPGGAEQQFTVLGATGNVYQVHIGCHPRCNCPDFMRRREACKHVLFAFLRVLRRRDRDPLVWQKALTPSEANEVLSSLRGNAVDTAALANENVVRMYQRATRGLGAEEEEEEAQEAPATQEAAGASRRKPIEGDCPICYEALVPEGSGAARAEEIVFCDTCGNNVHKACFNMWARGKSSPTCVYCRAPWHKAAPPAASPAARGGGFAAGSPSVSGPFGHRYLNLNQAQGTRGPAMRDLYDGYYGSLDY